MNPEVLHDRLAGAGVPLFTAAEAAPAPMDRAGLATLLADLLAHRGSSLSVAIPCLLAAQDRAAAGAVADAAARLDAGQRQRLGLLYRLARCLVASREDDLAFYLGRRVVLEPWAGEPGNLPDPAVRYGHSCLREAQDAEENTGSQGFSADAERTFDTWLRLLAAGRTRT